MRKGRPRENSGPICPGCGGSKVRYRVTLPEDNPGSHRCDVCGAIWRGAGESLEIIEQPQGA